MELAQPVREHARFEQALRTVVAPAEEGVPGEREDHGVRVQRPQAPEGQDRGDVQPRKWQLDGNDQANEHADQPPNECGNEEFSDDHVVVRELFHRDTRGAVRD